MIPHILESFFGDDQVAPALWAEDVGTNRCDVVQRSSAAGTHHYGLATHHSDLLFFTVENLVTF